MNPIDAMIKANTLNAMCEELNRINDAYPRHVGTLIMASAETEDKIEAILNAMDTSIGELSELDDDTIDQFTDVSEYRTFLSELTGIVAANREEVRKAREFLASYGVS